MKKSEVAEAARDLIEERGWVREWFGNEDHGYCLAGAVRAVYNRNGVLEGNGISSTIKLCAPVLGKEFVEPYHLGLYCFIVVTPTVLNDYILKDKEEIINFLTRVAKYWRDQGE